MTRVAVVTGCGSPTGIGFATAQRLVVRGLDVVVTSTSDRIHDRVSELSAQGSAGRVHGVVADLTNESAAKRVVAEAVQHAHAAGVIHRDLKPGNILAYREERRAVDGRVETRLHAKVIDFGLAKSLQKQGFGSRTFELRQGAPVGSPRAFPST